jgi:hypothetical protein
MSDSFVISQNPAPRSASTTRRVVPISAIVVHLDSTPANQALVAYTARGSRSAPHYHIALDGTITQLVEETRAARHSGTAKLGSRRRNIDLLSIGIVVEQSAKARSGIAALHWLVDQIRIRHGLLADAALLRWVPALPGTQDGSVELYTLPEIVVRRAVLDVQTERSAVLGIRDDPVAAQRFWSFLQNEAAKVRGGGFNTGSAFQLHAAKNGMGMPLAASSPRSAWITVGGRSFNYQHFARDTAFNEGEHWTAVQNLSERLQGSFPAPGSVEYNLLQSAYAAGIAGSKPTSGNTGFNPGWATTQYAVEHRLGPILSGAHRVVVDGASYAYQVFGADTIYTPIANPESGTVWSDVRKLSDLPAGNLREALWAASYAPSGAAYTPSSPFQQAAVNAKIGTPLGGVYQATFEGVTVSVQVFALDTLFQEAGGAIQQQSAIAKPPQIANWSPQPAAAPPAPTPQTQPVVVPAATIIVPGGDKSSPNWPPPPTNLPPLFNIEDRQRIFSKFDFRPAPIAGNPERIEVLGTWKQDNIVPVAVPQLAALAARKVPGAPKSGTMFWHRLAVKQLLGLWKAWEDAGLLDRIIIYAGDYNPRFIRGSTSVLSNHAFGTAFDINADFPSKLNWLGVPAALVGQRGCVRELVPIANAFGFYWGGHFGAGRVDGMHFEVAKVLS